MPLADTLLRLAGDPRLYLPKWTDQIMAEVSRNLQEKFGVTEEQAAYRESEIRKHFGEAWVEGYEDLIPSMTNHEKDRHVLAAAVRCGAETILTYNLENFLRPALPAYPSRHKVPVHSSRTCMNWTPTRCCARWNNRRLQLINPSTIYWRGFASMFRGLFRRSRSRNDGNRAMEPY